MTPEQKAIWRAWMTTPKLTLQELAEELEGMETLPFPLYHGSNTFALSLTKEQRAEIRQACMTLAPYYWNLCKQAGLTHSTDEEIQQICNSSKLAARVMDALVTVERYQAGSVNFEYEATYLTSTIHKAIGYADRSWFCGELHDALHWLQTVIEMMGVALPAMSQEEQAALDLLAGYERSAQPEGVILRFEYFPKKDLIGFEDGTPVQWNRVYRYFFNGTLQENFRACEGYSLTSGISVPINAESIQRLIEAEEQRPQSIIEEREKQVFTKKMLQEGFLLEDIQAILK